MNDAERHVYSRLAPHVASYLWHHSQPIQGTLAERYLRETMGLTRMLPETLGYCHNSWCDFYQDYSPSLITPIHDHGEIVAVMQTFLCPDTLGPWRTLDGRPVTETFGSPGAGAAWLTVPDAALGLTATVEGALAASEKFSIPVWATGEGRLGDVWIPPEIEDLVIFGSSAAAREAQQTYSQAERRVTVQPFVVRAAV